MAAGIAGPTREELIAEAVLAMEMGVDAEELGLTLHPHPTLASSLGLAAQVVHGSITNMLGSKQR